MAPRDVVTKIAGVPETRTIRPTVTAPCPQPPLERDEVVHFFSIVMNGVVCKSPDPARTTVDPQKVTCAGCRRFLLGEATDQWHL